jgi:hypothetical protein
MSGATFWAIFFPNSSGHPALKSYKIPRKNRSLLNAMLPICVIILDELSPKFGVLLSTLGRFFNYGSGSKLWIAF